MGMTSRAAIIAAGEGSRLRQSHPALIKPLVPVAGRPLCHWVTASLCAAGAREITVLLNSRSSSARQSLETAFPCVRWTFLQQDTASSWESFRLVSLNVSQTGPDFLVSTVDCLMPPAETERFARLACASGAPAALALTSFVDDEKPLWADLVDGRVRALGDPVQGRRHVTAGLYYLTSKLASGMPAAAAHGSLRAYLGDLVENHPVAGIPLAKTLDVDRPEDIVQAEAFIQWPIA